MRQVLGDDGLLARGYAVTHTRGPVVPPQSADWDQLVYAARGVLTVETGEGAWVVPRHRAVWVPGSVTHRVEAGGPTSLRILYLAAHLEALPPVCRVLDVPPLLRELVLHAVRVAPLRADIPAEARLVGVVIDRLRVLPALALQLPTPAEPRAAHAAQLLRTDPARTWSVDDLAATVGTSRRTLERLFTAQTGLTLSRWRRRSRVLLALQLLAAGHTATEVATRVGYATPSAFGAAFRAELGASPRRYTA